MTYARWRRNVLDFTWKLLRTSCNMSYDWSHREYYADDPAHYASPVFNSGGENSDDTIPRKQAPSLRRHSTCRPSTALYLPHKKPKSTFSY
ncbi:hypothetical protein Y032_0051g2111 [Ancylostoma ceylanicum]|nr:hypothetical protein Y032_0051g2111 [Ancylostoma ceylanicum]